MLVKVKLCDLPELTGIEFRFAKDGEICKTVGIACKTAQDQQLAIDSLIAGHMIVKTLDGAPMSVLSNATEVWVEVYAEPIGIFVGTVCFALATNLSDEHGRWHYWKYTAAELLDQALNHWNS